MMTNFDFSKAKSFLNIENNLKIGFITKTHGYKGQLVVKDFVDLEQLDFVFINFDGYLIPFFIEKDKSNFSTDPPIVKFEFINDIEEAKKYTSKVLYAPKEILINNNVEILDLSFVENFEIFEQGEGKLGKIKAFLDYKNNKLFELDNEQLIPINSFEIEKIDIKDQKIFIKYF